MGPSHPFVTLIFKFVLEQTKQHQHAPLFFLICLLPFHFSPFRSHWQRREARRTKTQHPKTLFPHQIKSKSYLSPWPSVWGNQRGEPGLFWTEQFHLIVPCFHIRRFRWLDANLGTLRDSNVKVSKLSVYFF